MITFLEGILVEALPTQVVVSVHGIGYQVAIPLSSFDKLPAVGAQIKILTHLQVREDAHILFGFISTAERDLFRLLINNVSGIGPKTALDILSNISISQFKSAVINGDAGLLSKSRGIGKKTAERIIVELKDKVGIAAAWEAASDATNPPRRKPRSTTPSSPSSPSATNKSTPTKRSNKCRKKPAKPPSPPRTWCASR